MNAEIKKFLKVYFAIAIGVWLVMAILFGPGDLSCEYRREYKEEHDRYLQITKSEPYKRYVQRPELNQPGMEGMPPNFAEQVAFVQEYELRPEFRRERLRSSFYTVFFQFFNAFLVIWIVWKLGKAPLLKMIDDQIHGMREKIAAIQNARDAAAARRSAARGKVDHVADDEERILAEADERLARETAELEEVQQRRLAIMERELEDRKQEELHAALMQMKEELVNHAVDEVLQRYRASGDEALQAAMIDGFTVDLEKMHP